MTHTNTPFHGLNAEQVNRSRALHGWNRIEPKHQNKVIAFLKRVTGEPMVVLLVLASTIYFTLGNLTEGIFLTLATLMVFSISILQERRSEKALRTLQALARPTAKVIRENNPLEIPGEEIVVGDLLLIEEGTLIAADATLLQANDFSVNESSLTGESMAVVKDIHSANNAVYQGTYAISGSAVGEVTHIGLHTQLGRIGQSLEQIQNEQSPLQIQIAAFVKKMAAVGSSIFLLVWIVRIVRSGAVAKSLLEALTIAMSIIPEEIPVAFATFMALGAWRLAQRGIIVKRSQTVETLGSASVICVDKTGTLTKNEMALDKVYVHEAGKIFDRTEAAHVQEVVSLAMWASESAPFDGMEKEIHRAYSTIAAIDQRPFFKLVHEYPLEGKPPMMTHVFEDVHGNRIIAVKGAPEAVLRQSNLTDAARSKIIEAQNALTKKGYRVLGVGQALHVTSYPATQTAFTFIFKGLIAFRDPPKENVKGVLEQLYSAGVDIKMITGDNERTASVIGREVGIKHPECYVTGQDLMQLPDEAFDEVVGRINIFARMFPEAKLRIIEALKRHRHVVGMTGDGINDGPALRAAHIGVAMGKGTDVAKAASALVLIDDDLARMVDGIAMGRKIYNNLKKAVQYIIAIHIPIIMVVSVPLVMAWPYGAILTPVHVIFLELIMGPTCSIIYENEPIERNLMTLKPRPMTATFFSTRELLLSVVQGLIATLGVFSIYWYCVANEYTQPAARAMIFVTLVAINIFLTFVNRSLYYSVVDAFRYKNTLMYYIVSASILLVVAIFAISPIRIIFDIHSLSVSNILFCICIAAASVTWFELFKAVRRCIARKKTSP